MNCIMTALKTDMVIKQNYCLMILIVSLMRQKLVMFMKLFHYDKEICDFSNYPEKSKYCDHSNILITGKVKDETSGTTVK